MAGVSPAAGADRCQRSGSGASRPFAHVVRAASFAGFGVEVVDRAAMVAFEAVAVRLAPNGRDLELFLVHTEPSRSMAVGVFHEDEIVAHWRAFAATSGLPLAVEIDGKLERPHPQIGRLMLGAIRIRRRHGVLKGRRPRFLARRKTGQLPHRPTVHRAKEISVRD